MTDELTPEEKDAFDNLPRERMPAGLEERVVGAMREHGYLAKRRRAIELTGGRLAGVLAASVALVIGAYSIGLHRGGGEEAMRMLAETGMPAPGTVAPTEEDALGRLQTPATDAVKPESERLESQDAPQTEGLLKERSRSNEAQSAVQAPEPAATAAEERSDESKKSLDWQLGAKEEALSEAPASAASPAAPEMARKTDRAAAPQASLAADAAKMPLTFVLDGKTVVIEAPDSVRIVEDQQGKMLLIYTSDGVIRLRLTD